MSNLRIFLLGAGYIARAHSNTARKLTQILSEESGENVELELFVADPVEAARTSFASEFPEAQVFATPEEMLALPAQEGDIAIIATPPFLHRAGALLALASGRHTLVEKPIAINEAEVNDIAAAAKAAGKHWGECSMRLYNMPSNRALRERLLAGEIGTPYHVSHVYKGGWGRPGIEYQPQSKWFLDKSKAGGGILVDWAVYDLANLTFLLSPVKVEVRQAWWAKPETPADPTDVTFDVETHVGATMIWTLEDGTKVNVNYERASGTHGKPQQFSEIEGSKGAYQWTWAWDSSAEGTFRFYGAEGKEEEEVLKFVDDWEAKWGIVQGDRPLVTFARRVRGADIPALMDDNALFNFRVLRALADAAETGEVITIEKDVQLESAP
jgi:predicted dehydrogenase